MSSILNTDLGALYDNWQQRVAFNEGFAREKITSARSAGAEAFSLGVDRVEARNLYFENRAVLVADAQSAMSGEVDDVGEVDDLVEVDDVGEVDDLGEVDDVGEVDDFVPFDPAEEWEIAMENGSYNIGSSDIEEGDGSGIDVSILFDTPQVYS